MFLAGRTPKRGPLARHCKKAALMASLNTSSATVRALVSGLRPVMTSCAPQAAGRLTRVRGTGLRAAALALTMLGVAFAGTLPIVVEAKALASASVDIVRFVWYVDRDGDGAAGGASPGDPDPDDVVLTTGPLGVSGFNTENRGGSETVEYNFNYAGGRSLGPFLVDPDFTAKNCTGVDCSSAPQNFDPLPEPPPFVTGNFVNGYASFAGFYSRFPSSQTGISGGFRSDISLPGPGLDGNLTANTTSVVTLRGKQSSSALSTYLRVEFAAQVLAWSETPGDLAEAELNFTLKLIGGGYNVDWEIARLATSAGSQETGNQVLYSFNNPNHPNNFDLALNVDYTLTVELESKVAALTPQSVPAPGVAWLLGAGLVPMLFRTRQLPTRRTGRLRDRAITA